MKMSKIVWLDAGHGGRDPGAVGNGLQEKNIVLELANRCGRFLLDHYVGVQVKYSRTTDNHLGADLASDLSARTRQANQAGARVFVSFHCNSFSNSQANGFETFIMQGSAGDNSINLQHEVHDSIWRFMSRNGVQTNRGKKRENFHVLRESKMPAILTECLFITNSEILKFRDTAFLQGVAEAHAVGIANFLNLAKNSKQPTKNKTKNTGTDTFIVTQRTGGFMSAIDATNNQNRRTWVEPSTYHVFKRANGMINVTRTKGTAGSWINPNGQSSENKSSQISLSSRVTVKEHVQRWVTGQTIHPSVYGQIYDVQQIGRNGNNEHILIGKNKQVTGWLDKNDLTLV